MQVDKFRDDRRLLLKALSLRDQYLLAKYRDFHLSLKSLFSEEENPSPLRLIKDHPVDQLLPQATNLKQINTEVLL